MRIQAMQILLTIGTMLVMIELAAVLVNQFK